MARRREPRSSIRNINAAENAREALRLAKDGKNFDTIAQELHYANRSSAYGAFKRGIAQLEQETRDEARALCLERLRDSFAVVMEAINDANRPLEERLAAVDRLVKLDQRIAKQFGLEPDPSSPADRAAIAIVTSDRGEPATVSALIRRMLANPDAREAAAELVELNMERSDAELAK